MKVDRWNGISVKLAMVKQMVWPLVCVPQSGKQEVEVPEFMAGNKLDEFTMIVCYLLDILGQAWQGKGEGARLLEVAARDGH